MSKPKNKNTKIKTALNVNRGIKQPSSISDRSIKKFKDIKKQNLSADNYLEGILNSDIAILSKAITIIESNKSEHFDLAQNIVEKCLPYSGKSIRIGVTGIPGVGKSTFIEAFGDILLEMGKFIAVLAVDPSSEKSKGSILGDKTRMENLSQKKNVFIRPSPSSGTLGGVARKTRETIILCEAAGFDTILIETVGVGQSETVVRSMVDFFLLLMITGAGDELQGIKRGIIEMADLIIINKADGDNIEKAEKTRNEFENALHYFPLEVSRWTPKAVTASSIKKFGIINIWEHIDEYLKITSKNAFFSKNRNNQSIYWMHETIKEKILNGFYNDSNISVEIKKIEKQIIDNKTSSYTAANKLLNRYLKNGI